MERLSRGHLIDREGWSHNHKGIKIDQDTMIEQGMSGAKKTCDEVDFDNKKGKEKERGEERDAMKAWRLQAVLLSSLHAYN